MKTFQIDQQVTFIPTGLRAKVIHLFNNGHLGMLQAGQLRFTACACECESSSEPADALTKLDLELSVPTVGHVVYRTEKENTK